MTGRPPYKPYFERDADEAFGEVHRQGNGLGLECHDCGHEAQITGAALIERFGPGMTLAQLHPHLVCSACGSRRVFAYKRHVGPSHWAGPLQE
jgi:DNA-directed RNA polymerase subunit RPC12/RpoP